MLGVWRFCEVSSWGHAVLVDFIGVTLKGYCGAGQSTRSSSSFMGDISISYDN